MQDGSHRLSTLIHQRTIMSKVMIVDDSPYNFIVLDELIQSILAKLKQNDFKIVTALNGEEAINKIKTYYKNGELFDLIFLDLNMPIKDGY